MTTMMRCARCRSGDIEFDLAIDERIFLSFWLCRACGQRGIARVVDRQSPAVEPPIAARTAEALSVRRATLPGRRGRRAHRSGQSRA